MKIFATGVTGLLGAHCLRELVNAGYEVHAFVREGSISSIPEEMQSKITIISGDILDYFLIEKSLAHIDVVIHCAAEVSFAPARRQRMFDVNVLGTRNIVNACLKNKISQLIHVSSVAALGRNSKTPRINESNEWIDGYENTNYAISKRMADLEVLRGADEGLNATILYPSVILGENGWGKSSSRLFLHVMNENIFYAEGILNFVDVRDVCNLIIKCINNLSVCRQSFVVSAGSITYKDFMEKVARRLGRRAPFVRMNVLLWAVVWRIESIKAFFSKNEPLITKETAKVSRASYFYENKKVIDWFDYQFGGIDSTLDRVCESYLK